MSQPIDIEPGRPIRLADLDPSFKGDVDKRQAERETAENVTALDDLGYRLYAENRRSLLIVLQGLDTCGKDGTIRKVLTGFDPQSCSVTSFKKPTEEELEHDFLWRIHKALPCRGEVGVFNRSHYEDVVIVRVHGLVPEKIWKSRYETINSFERLVATHGTIILKFFLHIGKDEQRARLQARLDDPTKRWKFNPGDLDERKHWDDYQQAYEDAINRCTTEWAPWHVVPADRKWYRNLVISRIVRRTLEEADPRFPPGDPGLEGTVVE